MSKIFGLPVASRLKEDNLTESTFLCAPPDSKFKSFVEIPTFFKKSEDVESERIETPRSSSAFFPLALFTSGVLVFSLVGIRAYKNKLSNMSEINIKGRNRKHYPHIINNESVPRSSELTRNGIMSDISKNCENRKFLKKLNELSKHKQILYYSHSNQSLKLNSIRRITYFILSMFSQRVMTNKNMFWLKSTFRLKSMRGNSIKFLCRCKDHIEFGERVEKIGFNNLDKCKSVNYSSVKKILNTSGYKNKLKKNYNGDTQGEMHLSNTIYSSNYTYEEDQKSIMGSFFRSSLLLRLYLRKMNFSCAVIDTSKSCNCQNLQKKIYGDSLRYRFHWINIVCHYAILLLNKSIDGRFRQVKTMDNEKSPLRVRTFRISWGIVNGAKQQKVTCHMSEKSSNPSPLNHLSRGEILTLFTLPLLINLVILFSFFEVLMYVCEIEKSEDIIGVIKWLANKGIKQGINY